MKVDDLIKLRDKYIDLSKGVIDYDKFNHYYIVHHGASIEGYSLTKEETYLLLEKDLTPSNKPLMHSSMVKDHYNALNFVISLAERKEKLNLDVIQKISALILKNSGGIISSLGGDFDSSKGDFRKTTVRAGDRTFIDYKKVPTKVNELLEYINNTIDKKAEFIENSKLAYSAHFQMVSIHPFADGNGRISRLLMNYVQAYNNEPLTIVFEQDKKEYIQALEKTREKEDINVFYDFMFSQTVKYFKKEIVILTKEQKEKKETTGYKKGKGFNFLF